MNREQKTSNRFSDVPRDRPHREGCEHANLERPGAQAHPRARGWHSPATSRATGWRLA
ncbi:MAG: hypothetical protein JWQ13_2841 [Ramlibacter sp.]|jgi:hypothetical protein|nr:hypothetical protein [Ramlibacter sp.]